LVRLVGMMGKRKTYGSVAENYVREQRSPSRSAEVRADVVVPLLQSAVTGLAGVVAGLAFWGVRGGLALGLAVFCVTWLSLLMDHRRLLWRIERVSHLDLDRDGVRGEPEVVAKSADLADPGWIAVDAERARRQRASSEAERKREAVLRLVHLVWARQDRGRPAGQKALRKHPLPHGYAVTDEFHREVGEVLVKNGLAQRKGTGWILVATPEEVEAAIRAW